MKLTKLNSIFDIVYGNQLNFNAMAQSKDGINFVGRSRVNMGIVGRVKPIDGQRIFPAGAITVSLGGTYLLSSFVQPKEFYTAQNVKVLQPKADMPFAQKIAYCVFIECNRFRYSSHGREANRSLDELLVPSLASLPEWAANAQVVPISHEGHVLRKPPYEKYSTTKTALSDLFNLVNGIATTRLRRSKRKENSSYVPLVRPSRTQIGSFAEYVDTSSMDRRHVYPSGTLYVSTNGQGSHTHAYVSVEQFVPNSDVTVLLPKRDMCLQEKLFYSFCITRNRRLFSYGRKPKGDRLKAVTVPEYPPEYVYEKDYLYLSDSLSEPVTRTQDVAGTSTAQPADSSAP